MTRQLRGRVVVREILPRETSKLWTPSPNPRSVGSHRGVVLAMGPPALQSFRRWEGGAWIGTRVEVPYGFVIGDVIRYHFTFHQDAATRLWDDGKPATWIPQANCDAVDEGLTAEEIAGFLRQAEEAGAVFPLRAP